MCCANAVPPRALPAVEQGEMGEAFVEHLQALAAKLEYVAGDDTARFSAAFRCAPRLRPAGAQQAASAAPERARAWTTDGRQQRLHLLQRAARWHT